MSDQPPNRAASADDVANQKIDLCVSNAIVKTGIGFGAGVILSLILFKRRAFPIWLGTGFGIGSGYSDCDRLYRPTTIPGVRIVGWSSSASSPPSAAAPAPVLERLTNRAGDAVTSARQQLEPKIEQATDVARQGLEGVKERIKQGVDDVKEKVR